MIISPEYERLFVAYEDGEYLVHYDRDSRFLLPVIRNIRNNTVMAAAAWEQSSLDDVVDVARFRLHTIRTVLNQIVQCWRRPYCTDREQLEIEAESVAFIVCQYLGLDTSEFSINYIAKYSYGKERGHLEQFLDNIQKTALFFINSIEGVREASRIGYDISEYFLVVSRKTALNLFQNGSSVYLVYPGKGELLAMKKKDLEEHAGPYAADRSVWFNTSRMAA